MYLMAWKGVEGAGLQKVIDLHLKFLSLKQPCASFHKHGELGWNELLQIVELYISTFSTGPCYHQHHWQGSCQMDGMRGLLPHPRELSKAVAASLPCNEHTLDYYTSSNSHCLPDIINSDSPPCGCHPYTSTAWVKCHLGFKRQSSCILADDCSPGYQNPLAPGKCGCMFQRKHPKLSLFGRR